MYLGFMGTAVGKMYTLGKPFIIMGHWTEKIQFEGPHKKNRHRSFLAHGLPTYPKGSHGAACTVHGSFCPQKGFKERMELPLLGLKSYLYPALNDLLQHEVPLLHGHPQLLAQPVGDVSLPHQKVGKQEEHQHAGHVDP